MIRLFLRFFAGMLLALLAAAAIVYVLLKYPPGRPTGHELYTQMLQTARIITAELSAVDQSDWPTIITRHAELSGLNVQHAAVIDMNLPEADIQTLARGDPIIVAEDEGGPIVWLQIPGSGHIVDVVSHEPLTNPYPIEILIAAMGALAVIGLFGFFLLMPVFRRVKSLEQAAHAFGQGEWTMRADDRHPDTIGDLAHALNRMAEQIQQLLREQQELLQAVAHEFRAPMSRLRFAIEIAREADHKTEQTDAFEDMEEALEELGQLVTEVLSYARLQPGTPSLNLDIVTIDTVIDPLLKQQRELNPDVAITIADGITGSAIKSLNIEVDTDYFYRTILNLVSNATRYAHSQVQLAWGMQKDSFWLTVDDDGLGIPPYQRQRVFEPFTRLDPSRSRHSGGTGLGLAIVRRISEKHHGTVSVEESPLGGARFKLIWPLRSNQSIKDKSSSTDVSNTNKLIQ